MPARPEPDPLAALDPSARRAGPRVRIAVGAAVVLFIAAVAVAAMLSFASGGGGEQGVIDASDARPDAAGVRRASRPGVGTAPLLVHVLGAVAQPGLVELDGRRACRRRRGGGRRIHGRGRSGRREPRAPGRRRRAARGARGRAGAGAGGGSPGGAAASGDGLVHLNTADLAALDTLPRIGPALAQRIIDWREANGPFTSVDQLLEVAGIGDAVFAGLADRVAL